MKELGVRAMTGAVYVALTLGAAMSGPFTTFLLFLPVCIIGMRELYLLYWSDATERPVIWTMLAGATVYIAVAMAYLDKDWTVGYTVALAFVLMLVSISWTLLTGQHDPAHTLGGLLTGLLLVAVPFGLLTHFFEYGSWLFIAFMVLLWTNDTGAYLVGRAIGRTKLLPALSPKKTVEGLLGGIALTLGVAWLFSIFHQELKLHEWLTVAGIVAITATLGDLLESAFKRARGVKDSGNILPGHGGILDRFDGFVLAVPAVLLYLELIR